MFPDSDIAKQFTCGERKVAYLTTFGIAPHFSSLMKAKAKKESGFVLLFDESLNREMKKCQLDMHVRFWNDNQVNSRYLISVFMSHHTAEQMHKRTEKVCSDTRTWFSCPSMARMWIGSSSHWLNRTLKNKQTRRCWMLEVVVCIHYTTLSEQGVQPQTWSSKVLCQALNGYSKMFQHVERTTQKSLVPHPSLWTFVIIDGWKMGRWLSVHLKFSLN